MPAFEIRTGRKSLQAGVAKAGARFAEIRTAVAGVVAEILRGVGPAPVLQPIPVRVRPRRRS